MGKSLTARVCLVVAAGAAMGLAFPPYALWWLIPLAVAAITLAVRGRTGREGALLGFLAGLAFFLVLLTWLRIVGPDAWVLLSVLEALFWLPLGIGLTLVPRLPAWPVWAASLWVLTETLRSAVPFGGFPWGQLAFATVDTPFLPLASVGGAALVTFALALAGSLLAAALVAITSGEVVRPGAALAGVAAIVLVPVTLPAPPAASGTIHAAVIQGSVPGSGLDFHGERRAVLNNHVTATRQLADDVAAGRVDQPELVIWPENASDINPFADPDAYEQIDGVVREVGVPVLVGALVDTPDGQAIENSGIVWDPTSGPLERYVKRHPVPFGEYVPFRSLLAKLGIERLDRIPRDFVSGQRAGLLETGPARAGELICFEVAYDGLVRDVVDGGAQILVVQTNNATYGGTGQLEQQFAISRFRAVEHQRSVLVAATSGISGIIDRDGSLTAVAPESQQRVLVGDAAMSTTRSIASRLGPAPGLVLSALALVGLALGWRRTRTRNQEPGTQVSVPLPSHSVIVSEAARSDPGVRP